MSINSMASAAVVRQETRGMRVAPTSGTGMPGGTTTTTAPTTSEQVTSMLTTITTYIPTEVLTLYVAVRSALTKGAATVTGAVNATGNATVVQPGTVGAGGENWPEWFAFFLFLVITPVVVWIVFAVRLRSSRHRLPVNPRQWPLWEMVAATIAFVAWAFGLPNSVFNLKPYHSPAIAAVVVLVTSTFLGLLTPLFAKSR